MGASLKAVLLTSLAGLLVLAAERSFELRGHIEPPPPNATVSIAGVLSGFTASTKADSKGRFRFRKLSPGLYTLTVFAPGAGVTRRTVDVSAGLADSRGRVDTIIPFSESTVSGVRLQRGRNTVSIRELAIPERARSEYDKAQGKLGRKDSAGAAVHLRRAVELAPHYMMAWNELGTIAFRAQNWTEAEVCFRKALEARPGALMPMLNLGGVLLYLKRYEEALEHNRTAVERSPNNALANLQLGMTYFMLEQDEEALRYLEVAKRLDPSHYSNPQLALADIYLRRGNHAGAIGELEDYLARHPDAPNAQKVRDQIGRLKRR